MAKYNQNAVWADALKLTRTHWPALIAIAGVFNFLPSLLVNYFCEMPDPPVGASAQTYIQFVLDHYRQNALPIVLQSFVVMIGTAAMLRLVFARGGTVGAALLYGIVLLPAFSILIVLSNLAVGFGFVLLIVPGLYLWGRLLPASAAMVAEEWRNPIEALRRGWTLSQGHGWLNISLYLLVAVAAGVLMLSVSMVVGIIFKAAAGPQLGALLEMIVLCAMQAVAATILTMLTAAIYRALAPARPAG